MTFQLWDYCFSSIYANNVDTELVWHFKVGLALGVVIATSLTLFPGRPWGVPYDGSADDERENKEGPITESATKQAGRKTETMRVGDSSDGSSGKKRVELQATTDAAVVSNSTQTPQDGSSAARVRSSSPTPHQSQRETESTRASHRQLNLAVYTFLVCGLVVILDRSYGRALSTWFRICFPREANTLSGTSSGFDEESSSV